MEGIVHEAAADRAGNNIRWVDPRTMVSMFRSKDDVYDFFKHQCKFSLADFSNSIEGYLLPQYKKCPLSFLRACMTKKKLLLKASECRTVNIPRYAEVSMKNLIAEAYHDPLVINYLPDYENEDMKPDREYFYTVMSTLRFEFTHGIVQMALQARNTGQDKTEDDMIAIHQDFYNDIHSANWISSKFALVSFPFIEKKGKGIHLLKTGAKLVIKNRKKPRKVDRKNLVEYLHEVQQHEEAQQEAQLSALVSSKKRLNFEQYEGDENITPNTHLTDITADHRTQAF